MIRKFTITVVLITCVTLTYAQVQTQSSRDIFGNQLPTARERVLDSLGISGSHAASMLAKIPVRKPIHAKSASSYTTRLDSILHGEGQLRDIYQYDANGNCTLEAYYFWDEVNGWMSGFYMEMDYDVNNLLVERAVLENYRETYVYQEDGLVAEMIEFFWETNEWMPSFKIINAYDDQNILVETISYTWNQNTQEFEEISQTTYEYNESGGLLESIRSFWGDNQWVASQKEIHTLNDDDQPLLTVHYIWGWDNQTWEPNASIDFIYNAAGLELEQLYSNWDDGIFVPYAKYIQGYDDLNRRIYEGFLYWDESENEWYGSYFYTFEYDDLNNPVATFSYNWNEQSGYFETSSMRVNTFDLEYLSVNIMAPEGYAEYFATMALTSTFFLIEDGQLVDNGTAYFHYSPVDITSVDNAAINTFQVYPNPFRETIRFSNSQELKHFTLLDLQGRVVLQKQISGASEVYTGDLPAGLYVYRIDGLHGRQIGKLVRE